MDCPAHTMDCPALTMGCPAHTMDSPALTMDCPAHSMDCPALTMGSPAPTMGQPPAHSRLAGWHIYRESLWRRPLQGSHPRPGLGLFWGAIPAQESASAGRLLEHSWGLLGRSWRLLECPWSDIRRSRGALGAPLGSLCAPLECPWSDIRRSRGALGAPLGSLCAPLETIRGALGSSLSAWVLSWPLLVRPGEARGFVFLGFPWFSLGF